MREDSGGGHKGWLHLMSDMRAVTVPGVHSLVLRGRRKAVNLQF